MKRFGLKCAILVLGCQVICGTRVQPLRLPGGQTKLVTAPTGDATTTMYLEATKAHLYPKGILTSIVDTFINGGTTTEYMTQHVGTSVDDMYAKIQTTSSREYYRIAPTASQDYNAPVRPTGLIGSSTSLDINGPVSTYYTVEEYRTYLDGHYAHLVSSISNVVSDAEQISPTPRFEFQGSLNSDTLAEENIKKSLFSSYGLGGSKPVPSVKTRTIGHVFVPADNNLEVEFDIDIDNEIEDFAGSVKRPRAIDLDDLVAIESESNEIIIKPEKANPSLPTFTVGSNGELNFPTPSIEIVKPIVEKKSSGRQHRFLPQKEVTQSVLDSVTYVGFVDFTTTIDDTVVIFRPKNQYNTQIDNGIQQAIEPTSAFTSAYQPTVRSTRPSLLESKVPKSFNFQPVEQDITSSLDEEKNEQGNEDQDDVPKHTSGINALKSLLASSAALRSSVYNPNTRSRFSPSPSSSSVVTPTVRPSLEVSSTSLEPELDSTTEPIIDIVPSIESTSDVELVFKTLYTTYTYFTTFFRESTTRIKSREEVISNVLTLTNILKSSDLPAISSSCKLDSSCLFASTNAPELQDFSDGFIGRPNTAPVEQARSEEGRKIDGFVVENDFNLDVDAVLRTFYTTYTYLSTIFNEGSSTISTRTEVYSNVHTESVPPSGISPESVSILPTSSAKITLVSEPSVSTSQSSISVFPIRRLEVSSIRNRQLQSELTTPETDTTPQFDTTSLIYSTPEVDDTTTDEIIQIASTKTIPEEDIDEGVDSSITTETPALTEEVTEVSTTETTESSNEIDDDDIGIIPKTLYTTFTYFTTLFNDGTSTVTSSLETVTNVMTDGDIQGTTIEASVTFFTTFTYWTTSIDGDNTVITSREETITDILPNSVTHDLSSLQNSLSLVDGAELVDATKPIVTTIEQTAFTLPSSEISENLDTSNDFTSSVIPTLQSSEGEEETSKFESLATTQSFSSLSSSGFDDEDEDFTLTTSSLDEEETTQANDENDDQDDDDNDKKIGKIVRPSRTRGRVPFSRPGNTFTPVIRPLLPNRKPARVFRPSNLKVSTTVATRTRNSVKPTLIATPASSAPLNTPLFENSSRFLASASLLSRGQSRFSSSNIFRNSGSSISSSISPSSVVDRGSATFTATKSSAPAVVISPLRLKRPNPYRARFKELQRERLDKIRAKKEKEEAATLASFPIPNLPAIPGGNAPIFVSSQRQTITNTPKTPTINIPDDIAARRERARERIKSLFSQRRTPLFGQSRRKRQVQFGNEFGSRTRERQSYVLRRTQSYPQPQNILNQDRPPFTAFQTNPDDLNDNYFYYNDDDIYSSSSVTRPDSIKSTRNFRRQTSPLDEPSPRSRSRSRSRSRFSGSSSASSPSTSSAPPTRSRTRFRDFRIRTTEPTTTTESPRFSRFRPRTFSSDSRSINSFNSNRNQNLFSSNPREPPRSIFNSGTSSRNNLFSRPKVVDYSDYDYFEYGDTDIQSSSDDVPNFITVTHQVPVATKIPVVEFGRTELRDILSTSPSLQVIAVTALKSTDISKSPVIFANAQTLTPRPGVQDILFDALRATETTSVTFTPTRIRGRRTSFSHILPSTIYNVETITTQIVEPVDQNLLLNSLLQHLLLGQSPINQQQPSQLPQPIQQTTGTQLITHTSTYVTTITEESSTVLPITLRGKAITTTIIESSTKVVTATEFSTETRIHSAIVPTQVLPQIVPTQAPVAQNLNQQIASLLPALLGNPLFNNPQAAIQAQQQQQALQLQQEALLAKKLQEQQQALLIQQQQQEALNEQLLAEINLDDFTDEDLANLDIDAVLAAVSGKNTGLVFPKKNLFNSVIEPTTAAPPPGPPAPKTSLVTIFKSGDKPGDFTSLVSTIFLDDQRRFKRDMLLNPSKPSPILTTEMPEINSIEELGGPRGPLDIQLFDSGDIVIEPSITVKPLEKFDQSTQRDSLSVSP